MPRLRAAECLPKARAPASDRAEVAPSSPLRGCERLPKARTHACGLAEVDRRRPIAASSVRRCGRFQVVHEG